MKIESVDFEITERCNFRCPHCYIRTESSAVEEVGIDGYLKILRELLTLGLKRTRLTGGEPLLRKDVFLTFYRFSLDHDLECHLNSNLTLADESVLQIIRKETTAVQSTLYGWDDCSYDQFVGMPGAFRSFLENLSFLRARDVRVQLRFPPVEPLVSNVDKLMARSREYGCNVKPIWKLSHKVLNRTDRSCAYIDGNRPDPRTAARMRLAQDEVAVHDIRKIFFKTETPFLEGIDCVNYANPKHLVVDSRGYLLNCFDLRHARCRVKIDDCPNIGDAINLLLEKLRSVRLVNTEYAKRCKKCVLRRACCQCPGLAFSEHGEIDGPPVEYYCQIIHESARLLDILEDGEKGWEVEYDKIWARYRQKYAEHPCGLERGGAIDGQKSNETAG